MVVRLGINPITWTNDDLPELGGDIPLETCLSETRLAGFAGTELGGKFPRRSEELGPILRSHGLDLVSGHEDHSARSRRASLNPSPSRSTLARSASFSVRMRTRSNAPFATVKSAAVK